MEMAWRPGTFHNWMDARQLGQPIRVGSGMAGAVGLHALVIMLLLRTGSGGVPLTTAPRPGVFDVPLEPARLVEATIVSDRSNELMKSMRASSYPGSEPAVDPMREFDVKTAQFAAGRPGQSSEVPSVGKALQVDPAHQDAAWKSAARQAGTIHPDSDSTSQESSSTVDLMEAEGPKDAVELDLDAFKRRQLLTEPAIVLSEVVLATPLGHAQTIRHVGVLVLFIDEEGNLRHIEVEDESLDPELADAAMSAFRTAKYAPGKVDGVAVKARHRVQVVFENTPFLFR